jgi:hypothetical protein
MDNKPAGMSEEQELAYERKTVHEALESFIDYKVNMPSELKTVSDYGIMLFPAFWLRIQKVILTLLRKRAATVVPVVGFDTLIYDTGIPNILETNLINKIREDQVFDMHEFTLTDIQPTEVLG